MKPREWIKQPWESRILEINCTDTLPASVTISSVECKVFDDAGTDVSSTMIEGTPAISGVYVYVKIKAGTDGERYNLRVRLTLSNGEKPEDDITIYVREIS